IAESSFRYSYHFPELYKVVPDQYKYVRCACAIMDRKNLDESVIEKLKEILEDDAKVNEIVEVAHTSMGMEISQMDLLNIERFATRVASLTEYRQNLHEYIKERMSSCAPSLSALIGEQVGARLISHAGSLTNLAKYPASTVQILGAEKALFRALKTRCKLFYISNKLRNRCFVRGFTSSIYVSSSSLPFRTYVMENAGDSEAYSDNDIYTN
ncbi:unnamed protein product, partial [Toxocara canis]|uniref:Nop domain-containing protein n=1 Tax=Toxocara canis TaxID=6265 RepID=A0A183U696_TOXCA